MNQKRFTNITLVVLVIILLGIVGYFTLKKLVLTAEKKCNDLGGKWGQCENSGHCCTIGFPDAYNKNKICTRGSDCQAKICEIYRESKPDADGNFTGICPNNYTGDPRSDFFKPHCGTAQIENGKIVNDRRNEKCVIY